MDKIKIQIVRKESVPTLEEKVLCGNSGFKTIASFDIGIKNLAYCIMEYHPERESGNQYEILDWDVVNLIENKIKLFCETKLKSRDSICGKVAVYHTKELQGYCKLHSKKEDAKSLIPIRQKRVDQVSIQDLNESLIYKLDKIPQLLECETILLEHQPSKNPKMKNLSNMLYSYFVIRGIVDRRANDLPEVNNIKFISPKNKLLIYDGPFIPCNLKGKYSRNKFYGKAYCKYLIRFNQERLDFFDKFPKKDDLADCFLQGAWYLLPKKKKK